MREKFSLDLYRVFCRVYEEKSFSETARKMFVSQSAISQSIKQLEALLGVSLFVREKKTVMHTSEAEQLYKMIAPALDTVGEAEEKIRRIKEKEEGFLRIGAADTVAKYYLLPYLKRFNEKYPHIKIEMVNRTSTALFDLLSSRNIDIAFANSPIPNELFDIKKCMELHDTFVAGEKYKHLKGKILSREEISKLPLVMLEKQSNSRKAIDAEFNKSGIVLRPDIALGTHDLLVDFAKIGFGVSALTREFAKIDGGVFELKQKEPIPPRELDLCWNKGGEISVAMKAFIEMF